MSFGAINKIVLSLTFMYYDVLFWQSSTLFSISGQGDFAGYRLGYLVIPVNEKVRA